MSATVAVPDSIDTFKGEWAFLSNYHPWPLEWDGKTWPTSEHAYNGGKTLDPRQRQHIAEAPTPHEAKQRGQAVELRPYWDVAVRYDVMDEVLHAKFAAEPRRAERLLATGAAVLIEGNHHHDQTWGDCRCGRPTCARTGHNLLGWMLMRLRADLRSDQPA